MIIWLASYPRSGNTFARIVLHRLYGLPTYSVYEDNDPVAQRVGPDLVGYRPKPADLAAMRESDEVYFVKTHKRRKDDGRPAIYLVRDGRDAVVSRAHLLASEEATLDDYPQRFERMLREQITRPYIEGQPSSGTWGGNVLSWLGTADANIVVLRYEDLIVDPRGSVVRAVSSLLPKLIPKTDTVIPSFNELHRIDPSFFRRGKRKSYRDEMLEELQALFWTQPENAAAMKLLGYGAPPLITL